MKYVYITFLIVTFVLLPIKKQVIVRPIESSFLYFLWLSRVYSRVSCSYSRRSFYEKISFRITTFVKLFASFAWMNSSKNKLRFQCSVAYNQWYVSNEYSANVDEICTHFVTNSSQVPVTSQKWFFISWIYDHISQ